MGQLNPILDRSKKKTCLEIFENNKTVLSHPEF